MESNTFCNYPHLGINCSTGDLGRCLFGNNPATIAKEIVQLEIRLLDLHIKLIREKNKDPVINNELLLMEADIQFSEVAFNYCPIDTKLISNIMKYHYLPEFKKSIIQMILILQIKKRLLQIATL